MTRRAHASVLVLASLAGLVGCGDPRLTVSGFARFGTGDAFNFPMDTRIDSGGATTGACSITGMQVDGVLRRGILVDIYTGAAAGGSRSLTVTAGDSGPGSVHARLQTGAFESVEPCTVGVTYADDSGSVTLDAADCTMVHEDGATRTEVDLHLELHGCRVQ